MAVAEPVAAEEEGPGARVYYEPKLLNAVSDHKTLELETVKLSKDIDPRKLPTELKLRRPVLQVMPASDPNWPAPPPQFDSGWPPPETVLTTSQPPVAARRRSFVPLVLLVLFCASFLFVLGAKARRRSALSSATAQAATLAVAASPKPVEALRGTPSAAVSGESASAASASAQPVESATNPAASATAAETIASATPARSADAPRHAALKPVPPPIANSPALNAPPTAKPKRAIY